MAVKEKADATFTKTVTVEGATTLAGTNTLSGATNISGALTAGNVTSIATPDIAGVLQAGITGTGTAPTIRQIRFLGDAITTWQIDLTGLSAANDVDDVIGKTGAGAAYLGQIYTTGGPSPEGVPYKIAISCLELPTASSNVLLDFDIRFHASGVLAEDGDASGGVQAFAMGGNIALGQTIESLVCLAPADASYPYLTVGATHTGACTFTAGLLLVRLWSRPKW
mgnify:CR=1 FL=1